MKSGADKYPILHARHFDYDDPKKQLRLVECMNKLNWTMDYGPIELANQQGVGFLHLPNTALHQSRRRCLL
ncbi:MAG: hypothetical protein AB7K41_16460 [Bdellovibrionales bacterium]